MTAGHILKKIDEALDLPNLTIFECKLIDSFGPDKLSDLPIPFDYRRAPKYYVFDEKLGLDFGLIGLESYYQGLLEKNNMVAVDESNWVHQHRVEFEFFLLLGLPEEFVEVERQEIANKRKTFLRLSPTMIRIDPAEDPPEASLETELPRFIGRFDPEIPLNSLIGMSGGPILGFKRGDDGQLRYWVVAVQSSQRRESGLIFGCPIPLIASIVESMMDDANDEEAATYR